MELVLRYTLTSEECSCELELCLGHSLFRSQAKQTHGLGLVRSDTSTVLVHETEAEPRCGVSLLRGRTIPLHRRRIILRYAPAILEHVPEDELCAR